jgi:hypothetical protein
MWQREVIFSNLGDALCYALLQLPSTQFVAQIYHTFPFTTCFGLMGPSSGTLVFIFSQTLASVGRVAERETGDFNTPMYLKMAPSGRNM